MSRISRIDCGLPILNVTMILYEITYSLPTRDNRMRRVCSYPLEPPMSDSV